MDVLRENTETKKSAKVLNFVLSILLIFAVIGIAFLVYLRNQNIDLEKIDVRQLLKGNFTAGTAKELRENSSEFKFDLKEKPVFCTYRDWIIRCAGDGISALNRSGDDQWKISASFNNPIVKSAGAYLMVYDMGGRDIYVLEGKNIKWNKKVDSNIINADINSLGFIACVREERGYKAAVTVFNSQGIEAFTRNIAENFVLAAKVSPKANQILIHGVSASGVSIKTSFDFTDMSGKPLSADTSQEDAIFPSVWYLNNEGVAAIGDSTVLYIDKNRQQKELQRFTGRKILSSGIVMDKYIAIAVSGEDKTGTFDNNGAEIMVLSNAGKQYSKFPVDSGVKGIQTNNDIIAVNTGRKVEFFNSKGKPLGKYSSKTEIVGVYFYSKEEAAIVTKGGVISTKIS